jgi:two-component system, OmpR family, response regulator
MPRVLVVDDEIDLADAVADGLRQEGFEVVIAHDGDAGFTLASESRFDAIVLDIMLPKRNGYRVCTDLRASGVQTPILMLTAKRGEFDEAEALDTGADDYLGKPFSFVVLLARVRALLRRSTSVTADDGGRIQRGDMVVDLRQHRVWRRDVEIALTARELSLLAAILRVSPEPAGKNDLLEEVWGAEFQGDPNVVEVYVGYIRKKIDVPFDRVSLQTVRGVGYRFDAER